MGLYSEAKISAIRIYDTTTGKKILILEVDTSALTDNNFSTQLLSILNNNPKLRDCNISTMHSITDTYWSKDCKDICICG